MTDQRDLMPLRGLPTRTRPFVPRTATAWAVVAVALLAASCSDRNPSPSPASSAAPVPVVAAPVEQKTMPVQVGAIGTVAASATVTVRSRVGGTLQEVHFSEGEEVQKDQVLFLIDPRPFEQVLRQAEALLARDQALLEKAEADLKRFSELVRQDFVTQEQFDQAKASVASLRAAVEGDRASVEKARLDLSYCTIFSPLSGRTGDLLVDRGNLVKANDDPLVVIHQIAPVEVRFAVPERFLPEIRGRLSQGSLKVEALSRTDKGRASEGVLFFVDNTVDVQTGTVLLKASFPNEDRALWPGQFVDVVLTLGEQPGAIVVPSEAVQTSQQGPFVFVVRDDGTAEARPVEIDRVAREETILSGGVLPGERVVTDGQLRLTPGARVEVKAPARPQGADR
jgi:multidrug efflux system membrane fusion protein